MTRALSVAGLALLAAGAVAVYLLMRHDGYGETMAKPFDKAAWTDETVYYEPPHPRLQMVDDVLANHLSEGQTRDQVVALLGPPTETPYFAGRGLVYWLGPERGAISVDSAWLVVDLDAAGRVTGFEVVTD